MKLWYMYHRDIDGDNLVASERFADIIDRNGLKARQKLPKPKTTDSSHALPIYSNIVEELIAAKANQLYVSYRTITNKERQKVLEITEKDLLLSEIHWLSSGLHPPVNLNRKMTSTPKSFHPTFGGASI